MQFQYNRLYRNFLWSYGPCCALVSTCTTSTCWKAGQALGATHDRSGRAPLGQWCTVRAVLTHIRLTRLFGVFQGSLQDSRHSSLLAIWLVLAFIFYMFLLQQTDFFSSHIIAEYSEKKIKNIETLIPKASHRFSQTEIYCILIRKILDLKTI